MLKAIALITVAVLVVGIGSVLAVASTKPDTFRVQRSTAIKAPPEEIFPLINDFRRWSAWSPYEHKDPAMKRTYGSTTSGKGAVYEWDGDKNVGSGRITITDASPPSKVMIDLDMIKPFAASNKVEFTLVPHGDSTAVTWEMQGDVSYFAKIIYVFIDMDRMVGGDFEAGLARLKANAEK
jgi:carbon monoxide dehydrogenase subunit G